MCKSQCFQRVKVRTKTTEGQYSVTARAIEVSEYFTDNNVHEKISHVWFAEKRVISYVTGRKIVTRVQINECCENLRLLLLFVMYIINE